MNAKTMSFQQAPLLSGYNNCSTASMHLLADHHRHIKTPSTRRQMSFRLSVGKVEWDPEGLLGPPTAGHITRRQFQKEVQQRSALESQLREDARIRREGREPPPTDHQGLVEYLLDTVAEDMEYEIARCRRRLNPEFLVYLKTEIGNIRFALNRTQDMEDKLVELEALNKILTEGIEAYDKMTVDLTKAKDRLAKLLTSKDKKTTLLEMVGKNEVDRTLLALLDENITTAQEAKQDQAVTFMENIRTTMLKYLTI